MWARYVQLRVPVVGRTGNIELPDVVRVIERSQDQDYTSILAEYGEYRREAIYEQQQTGAQPAAAAPAGSNTDA